MSLIDSSLNAIWGLMIRFMMRFIEGRIDLIIYFEMAFCFAQSPMSFPALGRKDLDTFFAYVSNILPEKESWAIFKWQYERADCKVRGQLLQSVAKRAFTLVLLVLFFPIVHFFHCLFAQIYILINAYLHFF